MVIGQDGTGNFTNCMFEGNSGSAGGAILADVGTTLIVNKCTFTGNKVPAMAILHAECSTEWLCMFELMAPCFWCSHTMCEAVACRPRCLLF